MKTSQAKPTATSNEHGSLVGHRDLLRSRALFWCALLGVLFNTGCLANSDPFWLDELTSYWLSSGPDVRSVFERAIDRRDPHPPGYQLALFVWLHLPHVADSGLLARGSSLLALAIALLAGASLATKIAHSRAVGMVFVVVYGSLTFVYFYGSELRSYMGQQAAILLLLLARQLRAANPRTRLPLLMLEYVAALVLGSWHYVGALFAGTFVVYDFFGLFADGANRNVRKFFAGWAVSLPYLVGPLCSLAWLVGAPIEGQLRRPKNPGMDEYIQYFLRSWGYYQLIPLALALALLISQARGSANRAILKTAALKSGVPVAILGLVILTCLSAILPALQMRNILLFWPSQVVLLSVGIVSLLSSRWIVLLLALFPISALPGVRERLNTDHRVEENFRFFSELNDTHPLLCNTDDIAQKIVDAGRLQRPTTTGNGLIVSLKAVLGTGASQDLMKLRGLSRVVIACPHCREATLRELKKAARMSGFGACEKLPAPGRHDKAFLCRRLAPHAESKISGRLDWNENGWRNP